MDIRDRTQKNILNVHEKLRNSDFKGFVESIREAIRDVEAEMPRSPEFLKS